jgi:serine/threonine protein kinase
MPILTAEERLGRLVGGRYRLHALIGAGGMGLLFRASDERENRAVAVKMLKPCEREEPDRAARFEREASILSTLVHPHVARFLDSGVDENGGRFLVMELLEGISLEEELQRRGVLSFVDAVAIVVPIAKALVAAHARGVVHRDVKPNNIFLCREEGRVVPKLLDFGIAKSRRDEFETRTGSLVGTPGYVSPEQARDNECGPFTDVWGVGAVLHRCLTGHPPHHGGSVAEMLARVVQQSVPQLAVPGLGRGACATVDRALAREPERRYVTMQAFVDALEQECASASDPDGSDELQSTATVTLETQLPARAAKPAARRAPTSRPYLLWYSAVLTLVVAALGLASVLPGGGDLSRRENSNGPREDAKPSEAKVEPSQRASSAPAVSTSSAAVSSSTAPERPRRSVRRFPKSPAREGAPSAAPAAPSPSALSTAASPPPQEEHRPDHELKNGVPVVTQW